MALSARRWRWRARIGDPEALVAALQSRHAALLHVSHLDERLALDEEILALAGRIGVRELEALGRHWRIYDLLEAGATAEARAEHDALAQLAEQLRQPLYQHFARRLGGRLGADERARGRGRAARARGPRARRSAPRPATPTRSTPRSCSRCAGARTAWPSTCRRSRRSSSATRRSSPGAPCCRWPTCSNGEREEGLAAFEELADGRLRGDPARHVLVHGHLRAGRGVRADLGDAGARARSSTRMLLPYRDRMVQVTQAACFGSAERFLGLLAATFGDIDAAVRALRGGARATTPSAACCR